MDKRIARLFIIVLALVIIGLAAIYNASYQEGVLKERNIFLYQVRWACIGIAIFLIFSNINYRIFHDLSFVFYGLSILLLVFVLIYGRTRLGAQRWIEIGSFNFQPSEFAKFSVILFLSRYFSRKDTASVKWEARNLGVWRSLFIPAIIVGIPALLIMDQPDLGTAIIFGFIFLGLVFVSGVKKRYIFVLLFLGGAALPVLWHFLRDYQRARLLVFINPNADPLGAGYTVIQSKIAVGSGCLFGRGWLAGTQSMLNFLPERHTDFIFSCFAEYAGFIGAVILLLLFYLLLKECTNVMYLSKDPFGRLLIAGFSTVIAVQIIVNIAMTMGMSPVVGIPLPFISYGGTSLLVNFMFMGIVASIIKRRTVF